MKKNALVVVILMVVFAFAGIGSAFANDSASPKFTIAQAKEIALKKVPGKVTEQIVSDDEKGKVLFYIFVIKQENGKIADVMVGADSGEIVSVEEYDADPQ